MVYRAVVETGSEFSLLTAAAKFNGQQATCEGSGPKITTSNGLATGRVNGYSEIFIYFSVH
jgi:hypothetical protein